MGMRSQLAGSNRRQKNIYYNFCFIMKRQHFCVRLS